MLKTNWKEKMTKLNWREAEYWIYLNEIPLPEEEL